MEKGIRRRRETQIVTGREAFDHLKEITDLLENSSLLDKIEGSEQGNFSSKSFFWATVMETVYWATVNHQVDLHNVELKVEYNRSYDSDTGVVFDYTYENGGRNLRLLYESGLRDQNTDRVMVITVDIEDPDFLRTTYTYEGRSNVKTGTARINKQEITVVSCQTEQGLKIRRVFTHLDEDREFSRELEI